MHIAIHFENKPSIYIEADTAQSLAKAIWLSGKLSPPPLCSNLGKCAKCKVLFISTPPKPKVKELEILNHDELTQGLRLACVHDTTDFNEDIELRLASTQEKIKEITILNPANTVKLAVDLGTTSLHWQAIDNNGQTIAKGQQINPQMGAGSDIISRLAYAMQENGRAKLANLVYDSLREIIANLPPVTEICLAANPAMTAIFLEKNLSPLAKAPYSLPFVGNSTEQIENLPPVYIPAQLAPFVGADISCGYASIIQDENTEFPFIFADLGTNAEFILARNAQNAHITSVPLGPALEGIGLSFGDMAQAENAGIVCAVRLSPQGIEPITLDGSPPQRICGTGYLSLVHCLLRLGILQENGHFCQDRIANPLAAKLLKYLEMHNNEYILRPWAMHAKNMYISASDIEEILKVKAAFSLAFEELLKISDMSKQHLKNIYLAGAVGKYAQTEDLEALGFIPHGMGARLIRLGNSSLKGAKLLLENPEKRICLQRWGEQSKHLQLVEQNDFIQKYMQHMQFKFTD